jgi:1-acyl-sn-glycerol-3-phosphate acyltransferase
VSPDALAADLLAGAVRLVAGASSRWLGCAPSAGSRIYFANHTSHLDFLVLWSALPADDRRRTRPVAAKDYWEKGSLKRFLAARVFRAVLIDRRPDAGPPEAKIEQMTAALDEGASLIVFPEGTRGTGAEMGPFKSGLYHLGMARPGAELVPVHIDNLGRILPKGEVLPVPLLSCVSFGATLRIEPGEQKRDFLERARAAVAALREA